MVADTTSFVKNCGRRSTSYVGSAGVASRPMFQIVSPLVERQFRVDGPLYITDDGKLRPVPRWATVIAVVDGACY